MVDEEILLELGQIADERGTSASQVIREALADYVTVARSGRRAARPLPSFVGVGEGPADLSTRAEELVEQLADLKGGWD